MTLITSFKCIQWKMELKSQNEKKWGKNEDTPSPETGNKGKM